jgi:hypothetical protein
MTPDQEERFLAQFAQFFKEHKDHADQTLRNTVAEIKADIAAGFPDGDARAHREYHEDLIAEAKEKKEFWQRMRYELYRYGVIGLVICFIALMMHSVGLDFWKFWDKFGGVLK